ncbi:hypothetical protein LTR05_001610 [Lithohypha guttulata]|uniref:SAM-dependent MTase RsmB/NOP-type domain-containing protein n=1 Tax=Lithohypha guttulata TaxID=1690604 RepID=A0AAN7YFC5_9EURO|nr:hypothetical protein LTR05_001610 [Lithohypha guttulata]
MALYYDTAAVLSSAQGQGSLKSSIYGDAAKKSRPTQIYALISQTAKRDVLLKEVIENAELLKHESKLTPLLALLLCHDHFFVKSGIAAPLKHPLRQAIERNKSRLLSELARARLKRKCASLDALKLQLDADHRRQTRPHPRWMRTNILRFDDGYQPRQMFPKWNQQNSLDQVLEATELSYCHDNHVPHLFAFSPNIELVKTEAYTRGQYILQDKASCFPAYLLLGGQSKEDIGDVLDGCAAPGNKTTHITAILQELGSDGKVFACERDVARSKTLISMVSKAGAANRVQVLAKQDFFALDSTDPRFQEVTHLLLDPSCSGSGILNREDIPQLALPNDPRAATKSSKNDTADQMVGSKKRKRADDVARSPEPIPSPMEEEIPVQATTERLQKLSNLQTRIVEHAMAFPAATRITYSTCSVHEQENEVVVSRLLASRVAQDRGWRLLPRAQQVQGMKEWKHRGCNSGSDSENTLTGDDLDSCIRCLPDDNERTMGFFVCAFMRDDNVQHQERDASSLAARNSLRNDDEDNDEAWEGFE